MKKYLYLTAALAIVGAVSCNKEISDNTTPDAPEVKLATLTATIGEPGTKTTLDNPSAEVGSTTRTFWCKDDKLSVFDGVGNVEYEIKDKDTYEAAEEAVFEGEELAEAEGYYALYPYTEAATLEDETIKGAVLPADQTAVAGNIPEGAALAAAYTEDRSEVRFKNVATTIGFTLTEAAEKVEFIAKGGEDIAGTIDITFDGEGLPTYTVQDGTGSNTVTLTDLEAGTYYFTILPDVTLSQGYELKIDDVLAKTGAVGATLKRSMIYSLITVAPLAERNLAFSEDAVTVTYGEDFTEPVLSGVTDGVTYESSNTEVATVDPSTGEVTLLAAGTTTITASAPANATYLSAKANYTLTVNKAARNLSFSEKTVTAKIEGEPLTEPVLTGVIEGVTYSSSNTEVATVDANGNVTIKAAGTTIIKASSQEDAKYFADETSYTITVISPSLWRLVGKFNGTDKWSKNDGAIPMYETETKGVYVAENVTLTSSDIWKFLYNDNWDDKTGGGWVGSYSSSDSDGEVYALMQNHDANNKYGSNHSYGSHKSNFGAEAGTYDIYLEVGNYYASAKVWVVKK